MRGRALALAVLLFGACDDGTNVLPDGGADLSASADGGADLAAVPDLLGIDATCALQRFLGFVGSTTNERRLDCTCGCIVDAFESNLIQGYWATPFTTGASFAPMQGVGLAVTLAPPDGGIAIGGVSSQNPVAPFFLDGDFDLLVDYQLAAPMPPDGHVLLTVQDLASKYIAGRERLAQGSDVYSAALGGIPTVTVATTAASGTLELKRTGQTIQALADGAAVSQFVGAGVARMSLVITGALAPCTGGGACAFTVTLHNARMTRGALVDRR